MSKLLRFVRGLLLMFAVGGLLWTSGCESTDSDSSGVDAYFEAHPYESEPREEQSPQQLVLNPLAASLSDVGQEVLFTAKGGKPPYSWSVAAPAVGSAHVVGWSQCRYRALRVGNNTLRVQDSQGHFAVARIMPVEDRMVLEPTSVTMTGALEASFYVAGGSPPYTWSTANPALGTVAFNASSSYQASYRAVAGAYGINTVTVRDAEGRTASARVTQNAP